MRFLSGQGSTEWVARLPAVVLALNNKVTHLMGNKPSATIKGRKVAPRPISVIAGHPVGLKEKTSPPVLVFIISATQARSKEATAGQQTQCGL